MEEFLLNLNAWQVLVLCLAIGNFIVAGKLILDEKKVNKQ